MRPMCAPFCHVAFLSCFPKPVVLAFVRLDFEELQRILIASIDAAIVRSAGLPCFITRVTTIVFEPVCSSTQWGASIRAARNAVLDLLAFLVEWYLPSAAYCGLPVSAKFRETDVIACVGAATVGYIERDRF